MANRKSQQNTDISLYLYINEMYVVYVYNMEKEFEMNPVIVAYKNRKMAIHEGNNNSKNGI